MRKFREEGRGHSAFRIAWFGQDIDPAGNASGRLDRPVRRNSRDESSHQVGNTLSSSSVEPTAEGRSDPRIADRRLAETSRAAVRAQRLIARFQASLFGTTHRSMLTNDCKPGKYPCVAPAPDSDLLDF